MRSETIEESIGGSLKRAPWASLTPPSTPNQKAKALRQVAEFSRIVPTGLLRHGPAGVRAASTYFGALLAMVHRVFRTFSGASFACSGAEFAYSVPMRAVCSNGRRSQTANFGTLEV